MNGDEAAADFGAPAPAAPAGWGERAAHRPAIYYTSTLPVRAGGEVVNLQHVGSLRRLGWRALVLLDPGAQVEIPTRAYAVPMVTWAPHLHLGADDWLVVPEVTPPQTLEWLRGLPCRRVIHNQGPYLTFRGFPSIAAMNDYPMAGGLTCSGFTRDLLRRWGSATDWLVVRPYILPMFHRDGPKRRQIAYMPRRRPQDVAMLREMFRGLHPDLADVPWIEIHDATRPQVAEILGQSLVFASLGRLEGLGLPPLEAMAAGCLVCGYDGHGGREYATADNGFWVADGDIEGFANALAASLRLDEAAVRRRVDAGRAAVSRFSIETFEAALDAAWRTLLGPHWPAYRLPSPAAGGRR